MASFARNTYFTLASLPARRGVRVVPGLDLPTRTAARGGTYRTEWCPELRAVVSTRVSISRAEPAVPTEQTAPAGTPTAGSAQEAPSPTTAQPVPLTSGVKAVGEPRRKPTRP